MQGNDRSSDTEPIATLADLSLQTSDHVVAFYRGQAERDQLMYPYLQEGLRAGHTCLCLAVEGEREIVLKTLARLDPALDLSLLDMTEPSAAYLQGGTFDPHAMLDLLDRWSRNVLERGNNVFARVIADMSWVLPHVSGPFLDDLTSYEIRANQWARSYPQTCVYMYDLDRFEGNVIISAIKTHPKVLMSGVLVENPYHLGPDDLQPVAR